jgi:ribosomal protein L37AE/L43A
MPDQTLEVLHCTECGRHPPTDDSVEYESSGIFTCSFCGYGTVVVRAVPGEPAV